MAGRRVIAVLRESPEFRPRHVQALQRQLAKWAPDATLECLSDVPVPGVPTTQLKYDWPDWWCKMEIFRPDLRGDFLLTDLDNVFVGPLDDILAVDKYTTQVGESNALAFMAEEVRDFVWREWIRDPQAHMDYWHPAKTPVKNQFGDGGFVKSLVTAPQHWEEILPGQVMNIHEFGLTRHRQFIPLQLLHTRPLPAAARVLLCWRPHRPWRTPALRRLGMYD